MESNILNYFGQTHGAFIHAHGDKATTVLYNLINCEDNEKILEIGMGTGATLILLSNKYKNSTFYGIDRSKQMYKSSVNRHKFCFTKNNLSLLEENVKLPYSNNYFDKIYLESVLGIQENKELLEILKEIKRVLKPNGVLIFNETIWKDNIKYDIAKEINNYCKTLYGIIQANDTFLHLQNWKDLLTANNFEIINTLNVDEAVLDIPKLKRNSVAIILSSLYDKIGKTRIMLSSKLRKQRNFYKKEAPTFQSKYPDSMQGVFFIVRNLK